MTTFAANLARTSLLGLAVILHLVAGTAVAAPQAAREKDRLRLVEREDGAGGRILEGTCTVFENRETRAGRTIDLRVVVLKATSPDTEPDPIFYLAGGPGVAAAGSAGWLAKSWMRRERDIVLVDQRGTGRSNPLQVRLPGNDANLQGYLEPIFREEPFRDALKELERKADLTQYTTPVAMDDLDEVRAALGYGKINLAGGSYGSRAALVYIRRHPETVRCAILNGIAPISFKNPLYHASAAQEGLERILEEVKGHHAYRKAFPKLERKFQAVLARLEKDPVTVAVRHPASQERVEVVLTRAAFAEALRIMMYYLDTNRKVPLLIMRAHGGDFEPFAQTGLESNRRLRNIVHFGMLMCVTGSEDIPRIDPKSIPRLTRGTFLGDGRVRRQMAVSTFWPRGDVGEDYGEPVHSKVPVLFFSGTHDPVTPPRFGEAAARHFRNGLHIVVPGAHGVSGPVITRIQRDFLEKGHARGLNTSGLDGIRLPPFEMPAGEPR